MKTDCFKVGGFVFRATYLDQTLYRLDRLETMEEGQESQLTRELKSQLEEYFSGQRRDFDIPYEFEGTDFQRKVWNKLKDIPYGQTLSYGELGEKMGLDKSWARAIGGAVGRTPVMILVP